jgi:hypothetical protein
VSGFGDDSTMVKLCEEARCHPSQLRSAAVTILRELHRESFCSEERSTGRLIQCYWLFGAEACYHLGGVLEEYRRDHDPDGIPWSETLARLDPKIERYADVLKSWIPAITRPNNNPEERNA